MKAFSRIVWCAIVLFLFFTALDANADGFIKDGDTYTFFNYAGASYTRPFGINDSGTVVGTYYDFSGIHGFIKDGDTYTSIDYLGATSTFINDINDAGTVVGEYTDSTGYHAFLKEGNIFTPFSYPGATRTEVYGINNAGIIVGSLWIGNERGPGFIKNGDTYTTFDYGSGWWTWAGGINNAGTVVGGYDGNNPDGGWHGFLRESDGTTSFFDYPGAIDTLAHGISDNGKVVGFYNDDSGEHSFLKNGDEYTSFDGIRFMDINNAGKIVGYRLRGEISGVPEPTTMLLLGLGLIGLAGIRRKIKK